MTDKLEILKTKLKDVTNLYAVVEMLAWDQRVFMPPGGTSARAEQQATLQTLAHQLFTTDEIGQLLEDLATEPYEYDSDEASLIRITKRDYDLARKLSPELVAERSKTFSLGEEVWIKARAEKDFSMFQETLEKIVDLNIRLAETYGYEDCLYDAMLNLFEPGVKTAEVNRVFDDLKATLVPLVQAISEHQGLVDNSVFAQSFDATAQWDFGMEVLEAVKFDLKRGRQDKSVHPFTCSFSVNDVRITTRIYEDLFPSSLFSTLHEAGHGLYEQNIAQILDGTPLASGTSLGVHESQSRLWENVVGRSAPFWHHFYPKLQQYFPNQLTGISQQDFYRAINRVSPSFIRVEADEVTYNMHIFLRFELEQELLEQRLKVADLPDAWNAKMESYLGITPPDDAAGVLQDIHWSGGEMGYFSTYTLGNVLSLQFYQYALKDIPTLPEQFAQGEFGELLNWFQTNIHQHGRKYQTTELIKRVTSDDKIEAQPYLSYIEQKFKEIYELS